jgi:hypothetical protein
MMPKSCSRKRREADNVVKRRLEIVGVLDRTFGPPAHRARLGQIPSGRRRVCRHPGSPMLGGDRVPIIVAVAKRTETTPDSTGRMSGRPLRAAPACRRRATGSRGAECAETRIVFGDKITCVRGRAIPCSAVARQCHKIVQNRLALVGEESVSGVTAEPPPGQTGTPTHAHVDLGRRPVSQAAAG